jgi:hypothetical protein
LPAVVTLAGLAILAYAPLLEAQRVPRLKAFEIALPANPEDAAVLGRPVAMAFGPDGLYIADALDCAVKVFSAEGRFLRSLGRKGSGPGELNLPSGVAVREDVIAVADTLNFRVQTFHPDGRPRGGFKLPFPPDRIFMLGRERLLVTANPTGRRAGEKLLHVFDPAGREVWGGLDARASADAVLDAFRNMILACPGNADDVFVLYRSGERTISRFSASGGLLGTLTVDERHASRTVDLTADGKTLRLTGFCWAAAFDRGRLYLSAPEVLAGRDLGPGRSVSVLDTSGRLLAAVDLPCPVHRFLVAEGRLYAVDDESSLRIFEVGR